MRSMMAIAGALLLTACGSSAASDGVASLEVADTSVTTVVDVGEVDTEVAFMELAACLREEGVDAADPTVDADGNVQPPAINGERPPRDEMQEAFAACSEILEGATLGFREVDQTELQDSLLEYAQCMRDNGFDMADPDLTALGAGRGTGGPFGELDRTDPEFVAADATCSEILGTLGEPRGGGNPPQGEESQ